MRVSAIVVAAGSGSRLGLGEPKAFVTLGGKTLLLRTLLCLAQVRNISETIIAVPSGMEGRARAEATAAALPFPVKVVAGGAERHDSVRIALAVTSMESDLVVVHDAARPLATAALFERCLDAAARLGGATTAIRVADTLKRVSEGMVAETISRVELWQAQTPQSFRREILLAAHERASRDGGAATDDAGLVERIGGAVAVVDGSPLNLKITTPEDLEIAEALVDRAQAGGAQPRLRS
jgi:2-C-methyl-D-erythritol 4-phosphate cytidylyltransferase